MQMLRYAIMPLGLMLFFQNCGGFNASHIRSNTTDLQSEGNETRFQAAKRVIQNNCTGCHYEGAPGGRLVFDDESEYITTKLIAPGSISGSKLITRLRNYTGMIDGRNMPPTGPISAQDYAALTAWVGSMPVPSLEMFTCSADEAPSSLDARRLSKKELVNSLRLVLARPFGATAADQILRGSTAAFINQIPNDLRAPFARSDRAVESAHTEGYFALAEDLANVMTASARYSSLITTYVNYAPAGCTNLNPANLSAACRDAFINNYLLRLWGRPLDAQAGELAAYRTEFGTGVTSTQAVNNFLFRTFLSPQFLHQIYTDVTPAENSTTALSSYAVARRLSYHFRLSGLDEELITLASTTDLRADENYAVALNRVSETASPMVEDFTDDWLRLYRIPTVPTADGAKWARVSAGLTIDQNVKSAMRQEILDLISYVYRDGRPVQDVLVSNVALARNAQLMNIYGQTTAAPAQFTESTAVRLPAAERAGLATRAGYLMFAGESERPVMRGLHVMTDLLCTEVKGQVPANAAMTPIPPTLATTRERYEQITSGPSCIGCHAQINPVGNAFAKFNAFGGLQNFEPVFVNGSYQQDLPTNARVNLQPAIQEEINLDGAVEFSRWMATSTHFRACVSRQYQAYAQRTSALPTSTNSCDMNRMAEIVRTNGSLKDFLRAPAANVKFRLRNLGI